MVEYSTILGYVTSSPFGLVINMYNIKYEIETMVNKENKLGSDCSGSDGTTNRTLTLTEPRILEVITLCVNGTVLHEGAGLDFTRSTNIITFLNIVDNTDKIRIVYFG